MTTFLSRRSSPFRAGRLQPLAVTTTTRPEALVDVPSIGDFVPGFEARQWQPAQRKRCQAPAQAGAFLLGPSVNRGAHRVDAKCQMSHPQVTISSSPHCTRPVKAALRI